MIEQELLNQFYSGKRTERIRFCVNDPVIAIKGRHQGVAGPVISIEDVEPEVVYLVEDGHDGSSLLLRQADLQFHSAK